MRITSTNINTFTLDAKSSLLNSKATEFLRWLFFMNLMKRAYAF